MRNKMLDGVLDTVPFGMVFQKITGEIFQYNARALEILGLTADQLLGRTSMDPNWLSIRSDGSPFPGKEHPSMVCIKTGKSVSNVIMGVKNPAQNVLKWIRINAEPVIDDGKVEYVVTYFEDISQEFESNQELSFSRKISSFLLSASKQLNQTDDKNMNHCLWGILQELTEILEVDRAYIRCYESNVPNKKVFWQWPLEEDGDRPDDSLHAVMDWCFKNHRQSSRLIFDFQNKNVPQELSSLLIEKGISSLLLFPMTNSKGLPAGFAAIDTLGREKATLFEPRAIKAMEFFADLLSAFFDRLKSFWSLRERIKELQCVYKVSQVAVQQAGDNFDFLQESVNLIPEGFLFPNDTLIELYANHRTYRSKAINKPLGATHQASLHCPSIGQTYLKASLAEGLDFLEEEHTLLERLADLLQTEMQRRAFTQRLEQSNARYRLIAKSDSIYFLRVDLEGKLISASDKYLRDFAWVYGNNRPLGQMMLNSICAHHHDKIEDMVSRCLRHPGKVVSGEIDKPTEEGGVKSTFWELKAVRGIGGEAFEIQCLGLDVSKVKTAENLAEKFKTVSDQSSNGAVLTDIEGKIEYINQRFCELSGFEAEEILGKNGADIFDESFASERERLKKKLLNEKDLSNEVVKVVFKSGRNLDVLLNATMVDRQAHSYIYYSLVDLTDRLEQERKIIDQNLRLEAILKSLPDQIFVNDIEGNYLEYYPGFNSTQRDLSFVVGRNIKGVLPAALANQILPKIRESASKKEIRSLKYQRKMDAEDHWFESIITPIDDTKVLRFVRDITVQKEYEEQLLRFNIAIHQSPVGIVISDLNSVIEYVSPSSEKISGYTSSDLVGLSTRVFSSGKNPNSVYKAMWNKLMAGETWEGELLNTNKAGQDYWERLSITPMKSADGSINRYMALKQNIHNERQFKENLIKQNGIFRQISNLQAHDVRGPIARIMGIIDLIQDEELPKESLDEFISSIGESAKELDYITRNIVELSAQAISLDQKREP